MRSKPPSAPSAPPSRRQFLWHSGGGLGGVALAQLLGQSGLLADVAAAGPPGSANPFGPRGALNGGLHHPAKARRVIQLFMNGGASQCDLFDYKPELVNRDGQKFDPGVKLEAATSVPGNLMKSPWKWAQHGQCGRWVSSALPHMAGCVDDLAFLMAMQSTTSEHSGGVYRQVSGFATPGFPCAGAWVSYALGSLSDNLPAFVVLPDSRGLPYNAKGSFSSGFLPVGNAGTLIKPSAPTPIADLYAPTDAGYITPDSEREGLALLGEMNRKHAAARPDDSRLDARVASYELAARMQLSAPQVLDLSGETEATKKLYGLDEKPTADFGRNCLVGRRMLERGVRFVQIWSGIDGPSNNWDNHSDVDKELAFVAAMVDKPTAGLLKDLKSRGMLDDTLVIWTTEFGRMPFSQGGKGRDHNGGTFVSWLAGGGVRPGVAHGASDDFSWRAATDTATVHDLHATVLHLLGIDHKRLTFRHNGTNRRLTDVHGNLIEPVLA